MPVGGHAPAPNRVSRRSRRCGVRRCLRGAADIALRFTQTQIDGMRGSDNVEIPVEVDAPRPGTYLLTVAARATGGWIGARTAAVAVSSQRQPQ